MKSLLCYTQLRPTSLCQTPPKRAQPYQTRPRIYQPSQINSRQLGGMMPFFRADATMPLCLKSARRTWQRRHKTRRFNKELLASLPDLMWSIWALLIGRDHSGLSLQYGPWQRPLSRCQMVLRVLSHISLGCLDFGMNILAMLGLTPPDFTQLNHTTNVPYPTEPNPT